MCSWNVDHGEKIWIEKPEERESNIHRTSRVSHHVSCHGAREWQEWMIIFSIICVSSSTLESNRPGHRIPIMKREWLYYMLHVTASSTRNLKQLIEDILHEKRKSTTRFIIRSDDLVQCSERPINTEAGVDCYTILNVKHTFLSNDIFVTRCISRRRANISCFLCCNCVY